MGVGGRLKAAAKGLFPERHHLLLDVAWSRATWPLHIGGAVECPVCGGRFRRFLSHYSKRDGARCPRCRSYERHRLLWLYLRERTDFFRRKSLRLLHMAPEYVLRQQFLRLPHVVYTSADLASPIAAIHADITRLPFPDGAFDVVLCYHVLEHIPDDAGAMRELRRVLAPNGWAILQVPMADADHTEEDPTVTDPAERERLYGQHDHVRQYGRDFKDRLEAAGFAVEVDPFVRNLAPDLVRRHGLLPNEDVYRCTAGHDAPHQASHPT